MSTPNPETAAAVLPETAYSFGGDLDPNGVDLPINFPITRWHALGVLAGAAGC